MFTCRCNVYFIYCLLQATCNCLVIDKQVHVGILPNLFQNTSDQCTFTNLVQLDAFLLTAGGY